MVALRKFFGHQAYKVFDRDILAEVPRIKRRETHRC
jgi:hypothetical protein